MGIRFALVVLAASLLACGDAPEGSNPHAGGSSTVRDLHAELDSGRVRLVSAWGNGGASGAAVEGFLRNEAPYQMRIGIHLSGLPDQLWTRAEHDRRPDLSSRWCV
jgi:hypothetical protein